MQLNVTDATQTTPSGSSQGAPSPESMAVSYDRHPKGGTHQGGIARSAKVDAGQPAIAHATGRAE